MRYETQDFVVFPVAIWLIVALYAKFESVNAEINTVAIVFLLLIGSFSLYLFFSTKSLSFAWLILIATFFSYLLFVYADGKWSELLNMFVTGEDADGNNIGWEWDFAYTIVPTLILLDFAHRRSWKSSWKEHLRIEERLIPEYKTKSNYRRIMSLVALFWFLGFFYYFYSSDSTTQIQDGREASVDRFNEDTNNAFAYDYNDINYLGLIFLVLIIGSVSLLAFSIYGELYQSFCYSFGLLIVFLVPIYISIIYEALSQNVLFIYLGFFGARFIIHDFFSEGF